MWRVTLKGQCRDLIHRSRLPKCRATEPCRSPHPGPWLSCTCRRSETLKCCLLKYSKTFQNHLYIYLLYHAIPFAGLPEIWTAASKSQLCCHPHPVKPKWMHFIYEQNQQKARWPWAVSPPLMMKSPANTLKLEVTAPWWHDLCQDMLLQSVNLVRIQQSYLWAGKLRKNMWPHSCL